MHSTPTQAQVLAQLRAEAGGSRQKNYRRVIGLGLGAAGLAASLAGMPMELSIGLWGLAALAWAILKAV